jgi:hypothetical protein
LKYESDDRISVITGCNYQSGKKRGAASYYFSKYNHCWGWATWRRSWSDFDLKFTNYDNWKKTKDWRIHTPSFIERNYWELIFEKVKHGYINSWAYPWTASVWSKGGLTATPNVNLVSNIGIGDNATNTKFQNVAYFNMKCENVNEIIHPESITRNIDADNYVFRTIFMPCSFWVSLIKTFINYLKIIKLQKLSKNCK